MKNCCRQQKVIDLFPLFKRENASKRFSDRQLHLIVHTKYMSVRCLSKQSSITKRKGGKVTWELMVPKSGYILLISVKVFPKKVGFY